MLLALHVTAAVMMRRPAGVALLRVVSSSAGGHQAPATCRVTSAADTAWTEVIEARAGPGASPGGVHGREQGGGAGRCCGETGLVTQAGAALLLVVSLSP